MKSRSWMSGVVDFCASFPVRVCVRGLNCYDVDANSPDSVPVLPGTDIPGLYGAANIICEWEANRRHSGFPDWRCSLPAGAQYLL